MSLRCHEIALSLLVVSLSVAACGGKSPTGPSPVDTPGAGQTPAPAPAPEPAPAPAPAGSAVVTGTVVAPGSSFVASATLVGMGGVNVSVVGTSISATADGSGRFTLQNVPSGDQQLEFSGAGANARLPLDDITERERIDLTVEVSGSSAQVVSQERVTGSEAQVEGRITALDAGARTLQVNNVQVTVPAGVPIRHGSTELQFSNLRMGDRVHVKGSATGGGVTANEVNVQQGEDTPGGGGGDVEDDASVSGSISGKSGACPGLQFQVVDKTVITNGSTQFRGGTCESLANGTMVEVEGSASGSTITAKKVQVEDAPEQEEVTLTGVLSGLSGQCPALTFTLQGKTVTTTAATEFRKGACEAVAAGMTVEAEGVLTGDTLAAKKVSIEKD